MLIHRDTLSAVLPAVCDDDTHYTLSSVQIRPDGTCAATNGSIAVEAKGHAFPDEDFPVKDLPPFRGNPETPVLIPRDLCKGLIAGTPKKATTIPVLACLQLTTNGVLGRVVVSTTDLQAPRSAVIDTTAQGSFPVLDRVMPKADQPHLTVVLSSEMLQTIVAVAKAAHIGRGTGHLRPVILEIPTEPQHYNDKTGQLQTPIRMVIRGLAVEVIGAVMPCQLP